MKLTMDRASLLAALKHVAPAASAPNATSLITSHALIKPGPKGVTIQATDLDVAASIEAPAQADADSWSAGGACVPAKRLLDIVSKLSPGEITLTQGVPHAARSARAPEGLVNIQRLTVCSGRAKFDLVTMSADTFPSLHELAVKDDEAGWVEVKTEALKEALGATTYAASKDSARPALTTVHVTPGPDGAGAVLEATDGSRMAWSVSEALPSLGEDVLIPAAHAPALLRLAERAEVIRLRVASPWVLARAGDATVAVRLAQGGFPDTRAARPTSFAWTVETSRDDLAAALKRVGHLGPETCVILGPLDDGIQVSASCAETKGGGVLGDVWHALDATVTGKMPELGLGLQFAREAVEAVRGDVLRIQGNDAGSAVLFSAPTSGAQHIVMPRTNFRRPDPDYRERAA